VAINTVFLSYALFIIIFKPLAVGCQDWQDACSTQKDRILICFIGLSTVAMATWLAINQ